MEQSISLSIQKGDLSTHLEQTAKCRDQRQVSRHSNVEIGAVILEQQETIEHKSLLLTFFFKKQGSQDS